MPTGSIRTIDFLVALNQRVQHEIAYVIRMEHGVQTSEETLTLRSGSCRDSAWMLVQILRHLGLAARFVSGYLIQLQADVKPLEGPAGPSADFTDLHAGPKCTCLEPAGLGWIPPPGCSPGKAISRSPARPIPAAPRPISGVLSFANTEFSHEMTVQRIYESPRVTKPYSEAQWREIETLGHMVDDDLKAGDVRLTMGGEPTFISLDDPDGAEWTTAALGPAKRRHAVRTASQAARPFRATRPASFRARKMVSRRAAAAVGIRLLLAQRRSAYLGRCQSHR